MTTTKQTLIDVATALEVLAGILTAKAEENSTVTMTDAQAEAFAEDLIRHARTLKQIAQEANR